MFMCGTCPRANCREHFPDYVDLSDEELQLLTFRCLSCYQGHKSSRKDVPDVYWVRFHALYRFKADSCCRRFSGTSTAKRILHSNLKAAGSTSLCVKITVQ